MLSPWLVYFVTIADGIAGVLMAAAIVSGVAAALMFIMPFIVACDSRLSVEEASKPVVRWRAIALALCIFSSFTCALTPSSKGMAAIVVIPAVVNNEKVQEMGEETLSLATEWIKELKPEAMKNDSPEAK